MKIAHYEEPQEWSHREDEEQEEPSLWYAEEPEETKGGSSKDSPPEECRRE